MDEDTVLRRVEEGVGGSTVSLQRSANQPITQSVNQAEADRELVMLQNRRLVLW